MSDYRFAEPHQIGEADNLLAQTARVTLDNFPALARVFVRVFPIAGLSYDVELTAAGTYDFLSVSGARVFVEPLYNSAYSGGTISGSVRAYTALLVEIENDVFSDTVNVVPDPAFPLDSVGTAGNDVLTGDAGPNRFFGLGGDDRLIGGPGADRIDGGAGTDTVDYGNSGTAVAVTIAGNISGGDAAGDTLISIEGAIGSAFGDTLTGDGGANTLDGGGGNDTVRGLDGNDILLGGAGDDSLDGGTGNDTIDGGGGNDVIVGGTGSDTMTGGTGDDQYFVDNAGDVVVEGTNGGTDRVFASVSYTLGAAAQVETLSTADNAGTDAIDLTGNGFAQSIFGNAGANTLTGGGGADTLAGFGGDDSYYVDGDDLVYESAGGGNDRVLASASYVLRAGAEVERITTADNFGTAAIDLTGNEFAQSIFGNDGANVLRGGGGVDDLAGLGGNDVYYVDADDTVYESTGGGTDRVLTSVSYALRAGSEIELFSTTDNAGGTAINLTGNGFAQTIYGNAGANIIDGGGGTDDLLGFGGNDWYFVEGDDRVHESAGGGADRVFARASHTLQAGAEVETLTTDNIDGTSAIDLTGNDYAQSIYGNEGANVLDGKGGADILVGRGGADTFAFTSALGGGNVDDVYGFVSGSDKIALDDAVFTGLAPGSLAAGAFVTGTAAQDADDRIIFNAATGQLFYDADGNGAGAAVQFATLTGGATVTAADFSVI